MSNTRLRLKIGNRKGFLLPKNIGWFVTILIKRYIEKTTLNYKIIIEYQ